MLNLMINKIKEFINRKSSPKQKYYALSLDRRKEKVEATPEIICFNENTLAYYRKNVKGNEFISKRQADLKISRNKELAIIYRKDGLDKKNPRTWYAYGALRFMVSEGEVKWIENHQKVLPMWYLDEDKYYKLSKQLGIDSDHIK